MATRKTARMQLHANKQPHIVEHIPRGFPGAKAVPNGTMIVSTPQEIDGIIRRIPAGCIVTLNEIRAYLSTRYGTNIACPVSTAIFINVVARAAEEMLASGTSDITPYWRVLKTGGKLNDKYPGGAHTQKTKLEAEGFTIVHQKSSYVVQNYGEYLFELGET